MDSRWRARIRRAWSLPPDERLFGPEQKRRMLVALLLVGIALGLPGLVAGAVSARERIEFAEVVFVAAKLACIAWLLGRRDVSDRATNAIVVLNTLCATASNILFPGEFRPITPQLLLAVLFVCMFVPARQRAGQLVLLAAACLATLVSAEPLGAEALRVGTLLLTGAAIALLASAVRDRYERLERQATTDVLTGVGNRRAFEQALAAALAHAGRFREPLSLTLIDLDGFKAVNDRWGHPAGDAELVSMAHRLCRRSRAQDSVFRLGGDEFAILLPGTSAAGAAHLSKELTSEDRPQIGARTTLSAGVAEFPVHGKSVAALTRAADEALLAAKRRGKAQISVAAARADAA